MEDLTHVADSDLLEKAGELARAVESLTDRDGLLDHGAYMKATDAIFRELVAVRDQAIKQCGKDCRWDAGYEAGRKSRHD